MVAVVVLTFILAILYALGVSFRTCCLTGFLLLSVLKAWAWWLARREEQEKL